MMRFVDETTASVWVETRDFSQVSVHAGGREWTASTFAVHGHHYALVDLHGLEPGTVTPYSVEVDGSKVWPEPEHGFPPPVVATLKPENRCGWPTGPAGPASRTTPPATAPTAWTRCAPTRSR